MVWSHTHPCRSTSSFRACSGTRMILWMGYVLEILLESRCITRVLVMLTTRGGREGVSQRGHRG